MKCLEITTAVPCHNDCSYCPQDKLLKKYEAVRQLSFPMFCTMLGNIPSRVKIHFSGFCEPFQNEKALDMLLYATRQRHNVGLYTTTIGLNRISIDRIKEIKIDPFYVHLPQKHFEKKWLKNVAYMIRQNLDFTFIQVGDGHSDDVKKMVRHREVEYQKIISRAGNLYNDKTYRFGKAECKDKRYNQNVLLPNGDVVLCCQDYSLEYKLGNILVDGFDGIRKSKVYKKVMQDLKNDQNDLICRKCFRCEAVHG